MDAVVTAKIQSFLADWQQESQFCRQCFRALVEELLAMPEVSCEFIARPGISFSLRPTVSGWPDRKYWALIDVIDDDPTMRWLSVCFYADTIRDDQGLGSLIPGGLAGGDGYCFDVLEEDATLPAYLRKKLGEVWAAVGQGK